MKKLKTFIYVYLKSLSAPAYYKELINTPNAFSMKYFVVLAILATALVTAKTSVPLIPQVQDGVNKFFEQAVNVYPQDLVVKVENGNWEINQPEPYFIKTPSILLDEVELEYKPGEEAQKFPENLIIFDHNGTIEDLEAKNTLFVMNGSNLLARSSNKIEVHPLKDLPNGQIDKEKFSQFIDEFKPISKYAPLFVVAAILVGSIFYFFVYRMIYLLVVAAFLAIVASAKRLALPFSTLYKVAVHSFTLPLTIEVIANLLDINVPVVLWVFATNVIFGTIALIVYKNSMTEVNKINTDITDKNAEPKL